MSFMQSARNWRMWFVDLVVSYFSNSTPVQHKFTKDEWDAFSSEVKNNPSVFINNMKDALEDNPATANFTRADRERLVDLYIRALDKVRKQQNRPLTDKDVYREFKLVSDRDPFIREFREKFAQPNHGLRRTGRVLR